MNEKTFFLIPGFKQKVSSSQFLWLAKFLKEKGYKAMGVSVDWNRKTNTECSKDFKDFYNKNKSKENYILGFSYGAVIAFMSSNELKPKKVYLCSLSPDFKEDLPKMKLWIQNYLGKKRIADIKTRSGREIAKSLRIPSVVFYGEKEAKQYPALKTRCEETARLAKNSRAVIIKNSPHNISHQNYIEAIKKEIEML